MGQHGQRLITRELVFLSLPTTSWSYFYSPAIVAFYDKRIYKKVTIEVIAPK